METEARRLYEEALKKALAPGPLDPEVEERVEGLSDFLTRADHAALRAADPVLAGRAGGKAVLTIAGPGEFSITIGDRTLPVPLR